MNCKKVKRLLGAYLYEDLEPSERDLVEEHLRKCEECRGKLAAHRTAIERIPTDLFLPGEQTRNRVVAQCREVLVQTERRAAHQSDALLSNRIVQVGITAIAFLVLGIWIGHQIGRPIPASALYSVQPSRERAAAVESEQEDIGVREVEVARVESETPSGETGPSAAIRTWREPSVSAPVVLRARTTSGVKAPRAAGVDDARLAGSAVAVIE